VLVCIPSRGCLVRLIVLIALLLCLVPVFTAVAQETQTSHPPLKAAFPRTVTSRPCVSRQMNLTSKTCRGLPTLSRGLRVNVNVRRRDD
jgi:hypothetical protein